MRSHRGALWAAVWGSRAALHAGSGRPGLISACAAPPLPFPERRDEHDGPPAAVLESPQKVRPGIPILPCVLKQTWTDPQIRTEHVPPVLQAIRKGHWLCQAGLNVYLIGQDLWP